MSTPSTVSESKVPMSESTSHAGEPKDCKDCTGYALAMIEYHDYIAQWLKERNVFYEVAGCHVAIAGRYGNPGKRNYRGKYKRTPGSVGKPSSSGGHDGFVGADGLPGFPLCEHVPLHELEDSCDDLVAMQNSPIPPAKYVKMPIQKAILFIMQLIPQYCKILRLAHPTKRAKLQALISSCNKDLEVYNTLPSDSIVTIQLEDAPFWLIPEIGKVLYCIPTSYNKITFGGGDAIPYLEKLILAYTKLYSLSMKDRDVMRQIDELVESLAICYCDAPITSMSEPMYFKEANLLLE